MMRLFLQIFWEKTLIFSQIMLDYYSQLSKLIYFCFHGFWLVFWMPIVIKPMLPKQAVICKSTHLETTFPWWCYLQNIQACLPRWPPFLQHVLWRCCNHPGIPSSMMEILLLNSVFHNRITSVSISILKSLLGVIGVLPLKPWVSPILSVCI